MKHKGKRILSILLSVVMLLSGVATPALAASGTGNPDAAASVDRGLPEVPVSVKGDFAYTVREDGTASLVAYNGTDAYIALPELLDGHEVAAIGAGAFAGSEAVRGILVPATVSEIGASAFSDCPALETVFFLGENISFAPSLFEDSSSLHSVYFLSALSSAVELCYAIVYDLGEEAARQVSVVDMDTVDLLLSAFSELISADPEQASGADIDAMSALITGISASLDDFTIEWDSPEYGNWKKSLAESLTPAIPSPRLRAAATVPITVGNSFLEYYAGADYYSIGMTGGNTNTSVDDNAKMMFDHPGGRTSNAVFNINGINYTVSFNSHTYDEETKVLVSSGYVNGTNIRVERTLSLFNNPISEVADTVRISFRVTNETEASLPLGCRIMWDTMLGNYDTAPFRVAGIGAIKSERELSGDDIPDSWLVIDNIDAPGVVTTGYPKNIEGLPQPDRLQFVGWSNVADVSSAWTYVPDISRTIGDSAVCIYWDPKSLASESSIEYVAYYGIGSFVQNSTGGLVSGADPGVYQLKRQPNGGYTPNEFTVTAFLENGGTALTNVKAKLSLPSGLSFSDGNNSQEINIVSLAANGNRSDLSWKVKVSQTAYFPFDTPIQMLLEVTADQTQINRSIPLVITIPEMDVALPYSIFNLTAESARRQVTLNWDDPLSHDQLDVVGYKIFRDNELITTINMDDPENNPVTSYADYGADGTASEPKLARNTQYTYQVYALNFRGDMSSMPATATVTTLDIDDEGPSTPTNLRVTSFDENSFVLNWDAAYDEAGIRSYKIYRDENDFVEVSGLETNYIVTSPVALTAATYTVEAYDNSSFLSGGNKSAGSESLSVGVDTLFQEVENGNRPHKIEHFSAVGTLSGISLSWSISAEMGTTYLIYRRSEDAGYYLFATIANRNTQSYLDIEIEPDTTYQYYIVGVNASNAFGPSSEVVAAAKGNDDEKPQVTKLTPQTGGFISGNTSITVTAQDNVAVTKVELYYSTDGGETWTLFGTKTAAPFTGILPTTTLADGVIRVKAVAYDAAGNVSDPLIYTYTVDNTGPEQVLWSEPAYTSTSVTVITLFWNDVTDGDWNFFRVERKNADGSYTQVMDVKTRGANIVSLTPDTEYIYRVVAYDQLNNRGVPSEDIITRTAADATPPVITALIPRPTTAATSYYANSVTVSATADDDYAVKSIAIQISTDQIEWHTLYTADFSDAQKKRTTTYTIDLAEYDEGAIFVRAVATDYAGNQSVTDSTAPFVQYIVDRTPPDAPAGVQAAEQNGAIVVQWTKGSEDDLGKYSVYRSASPDSDFLPIASALAALNYVDRGVIAGEIYYYKVSVKDLAGNESARSEAVFAQVSADIEPPKIVSVYPPENERIGPGYNTILIYATDNRMLNTIKVEYRKAGTEEEYITLSLISTGDVYEKTVSASLSQALTGFSHNDVIELRMTATDKADLESLPFETSYIVDKEAPAVLNPAARYENASVILTWTSDLADDLTGYKIYRKTATGSYSLIGSQSAVANKESYAFTDYSIALGKERYTYRINAADNSGNTSEGVTVTVETEDRSAPVAVIASESVMAVGTDYVIDGTQSKDNTGVVAYAFDFGDGTSSSSGREVHRYAEPGDYIITLTVTDEDGNTGSVTKKITVREQGAFGNAKITIVDENGTPVPFAPVYFDLGDEENQVIRYTDSAGVVTFLASAGKHTVGCVIPDNEWLPVKKDIIVAAGETTNVSMTLVHQVMIEGVFEIHRMTPDEITAAGIDTKKAENQYIANITVTLTYGIETVTTVFTYNGTTGQTSARPQIITTSTGETREITPVVIAPKNLNISSAEDFDKQLANMPVAILDIPIGVAILKEMFSVNLTIINNAASEFFMTDNHITLNLPDGLSVFDADTGTWSDFRIDSVDEIAGQTRRTFSWYLRGDKAGEYPISADYVGTLALFEERIAAKFVSDTSIRVYGEEGVELILEYEDTVDDEYVYFNVGFHNIREAGDDAYVDLLSLNVPGADLYAIKRSAADSGEYTGEAYEWTDAHSGGTYKWDIEKWRLRETIAEGAEEVAVAENVDVTKVSPGEIYWKYYYAPIKTFAT